MGALFEDDEAQRPVGVARALAPDASVTVPADPEDSPCPRLPRPIPPSSARMPPQR
jgi:hypothetical protein